MKVIYYTTISTPQLGPVKAYSNGDALIALETNTQPPTLPQGISLVETSLPIFQDLEHWLTDYWRGVDPGPVPPVAPQGTTFQKEVWALLLSIPYGQLTTYGDLAHRLRPTSAKGVLARAIGGAVGANPLPILIPCHRVIGAKGQLTGYSGGLWIKELLLTQEGIDLTQLSSEGYRHNVLQTAISQ